MTDWFPDFSQRLQSPTRTAGRIQRAAEECRKLAQQINAGREEGFEGNGAQLGQTRQAENPRSGPNG
jgi:hypothetical protein